MSILGNQLHWHAGALSNLWVWTWIPNIIDVLVKLITVAHEGPLTTMAVTDLWDHTELIFGINRLCDPGHVTILVKPLSLVWLFVNPMDCSLLGSSIHGIFQARVLEWITISFSRGSFWPKDRTWVSCIIGTEALPSEPQGNTVSLSLKKKMIVMPTFYGYYEFWRDNLFEEFSREFGTKRALIRCWSSPTSKFL